MRKLKSIHDALSRKDAHQFIVPELHDNADEEEEEGDDDDDDSGGNEGNDNNENEKIDNTAGQNPQAMRTSEIRKKACRDLLRILRRHAALSIIRDDLNKLLGEDAEEGNDMNMTIDHLDEFISYLRKDQMKFDKEGVRKLFSLLSVKANINNGTFRSAVKVKEILNSRLLSLETLKDHMSIILTHWYDTLPLPDLTHIGKYNIHQVKNHDIDESLLDAELELSQSQSVEGSQSQSIENSQDRPGEVRVEESEEEEEEEDENDVNFLSTQENTNTAIKEEDEQQEYHQKDEQDKRSDEEQESQQEEDEHDERPGEHQVSIKEEDGQQEYQQGGEDTQDEQLSEQQAFRQEEEIEQDEQSDEEFQQEEDVQDEQSDEQQKIPQEEEFEQDEQSDEHQELPQEEDEQDEQLSEQQEVPQEEEEQDVNLSEQQEFQQELDEQDEQLSEPQGFQQEEDEQDGQLSEQQKMQQDVDEQDDQLSKQQAVQQDEGSLASASYTTALEVEDNDFSSSNDLVNNLVEKRTALGRHKDPLQDMYNVAEQAYQAPENSDIVDKTPITAPARSYRMNEYNGDDDDDEGENGNDRDEIETVASAQMNTKHRSPRTHDFYAAKKSAKQLRFEETNDSLGGDDFPSPPPISSPARKKQKRTFWTDEETIALGEGFKIFGRDWAKIREAHYDVLKYRTNVNLKDKHRNLIKKKR